MYICKNIFAQVPNIGVVEWESRTQAIALKMIHDVSLSYHEANWSAEGKAQLPGEVFQCPLTSHLTVLNLPTSCSELGSNSDTHRHALWLQEPNAATPHTLHAASMYHSHEL